MFTKTNFFEAAITLRRFFAVVLTGLAIAVATNAATITVINTNNSGAGSLRDALAAATDGDLINFNLTACPCVIGGNLTIADSITIEGPGANLLTISGGNVSRVLTVGQGSGKQVTISGLTLANGRGAAGGGIFIRGNSLTSATTVTLKSVVVANNTVTDPAEGMGGGIFLEGGTLTLIDSVVSGNSANNQGGGIAIPDAINNNPLRVTIVNTSITGNSSPREGGGIFVGVGATLSAAGSTISSNTAAVSAAIHVNGDAVVRSTNISQNTTTVFDSTITVDAGASLKMTDSSVTSNTTDTTGGGNGGGIQSAGSVSLTRCSISGNRTGTGGGIFSSGLLEIADSSINDNTAASTSPVLRGGGGIYSTGTAIITGSTIARNTASAFGGGLYARGSLKLINSTVSGNTVLGSPSSGGGVLVDGGTTAEIGSSTITLNTANTRGRGIAADTFISGGAISVRVGGTIIAGNLGDPNLNAADTYGEYVSLGFNLIGIVGNLSGFTNGAKADQVGSSVTPINPMLAPLGNNGGPTETHALLAGSPAIDRGYSFAGVTTDQRGAARFVDIAAAANKSGSSLSDIGAYELSAPTAANVEVGGRVANLRQGFVSNATVILIDSNGVLRQTKTNSFGLFRFSDIEIGETYVIFARGKNMRFTPQIITITEELTDLILTADPAADEVMFK